MTLSSAAHTCRYSKHSTPLQNKTRYLYPNKAIYVLIKIEQFNHDGLELIRWLFFRLYLWVRVLHVIIIQTLHSEKEVVVKKAQPLYGFGLKRFMLSVRKHFTFADYRSYAWAGYWKSLSSSRIKVLLKKPRIVLLHYRTVWTKWTEFVLALNLY